VLESKVLHYNRRLTSMQEYQTQREVSTHCSWLCAIVSSPDMVRGAKKHIPAQDAVA